MSRDLLTVEHRRGWLVRLDPRVKLTWLLAVSLASVLVDSLAALLVLFSASALVAAALRLRPRQWLVVAGMMLLLAWGTILSQALFYSAPDRTVLLTLVPSVEFGSWTWPAVQLYREGFFYGAVQSLRMLAVLAAGLTVCLSTSPERLLAALVWARVPSALSFMTIVALRWLPGLVQEVATVREARRMRGYRLRWIGPAGRRWEPLWQEVRLFEPLLASSLRRTAALAVSVTSRGFEAGAPRTFYPPLTLRTWERGAIAAIVGLCLLLVVAKTAYWLALVRHGSEALPEMYQFAAQCL